MLIIVKTVMVPIIIALVTVAGRVWGPQLSGMLAGLPVIAGPILVFLALDYGDDFAASSAQGLLLGVISLGLFCFTYAHLCRRCGVALSLSAGVLAFLLSTYTLSSGRLAVPLSVTLVVGLLFALLVLFPRVEGQPRALALSQAEIMARMGTAALLVLIITSCGEHFGSHVSGLLAPFPVAGTVLAGFTHRNCGAESAIRLLRGFMRGLFGMAAFAFVMASLLQSLGLWQSLTLGCASALATTALVTMGDQRLTPAPLRSS